jgi:tetrahydromethanopterin S-methyltransferase subunit B
MGMLTFGRFLSRPYPHYRDGPTLFSFQQQFLMEESSARERRKSDSTMGADSLATTPSIEEMVDNPFLDDFEHDDFYSPPASPGKLSRNPSFSGSGSYQEDWETFPPLDKLTIFDLLDNIQLSQRFEKWQHALNMQREKVRKQREKLRSTGMNAKDRVMGEFKRRVPTADEQLEKYRRRMKDGVERLGKQWNKTATVTLREKVSFIAGVLNIFISGYLIGACPEFFYYWFTAQLAYFMPIRWYTYHAKGYHYFLADLCYFVNLLCMLSIWAFPGSKRLFISTYCLTFGNNAAAIAMWRNSLVFHSMDKVVRYVLPFRNESRIERPTADHLQVYLSTLCRQSLCTASSI